MSFLPKSKQSANVLSHWYVLMDGIQFSTQDFYGSIESELIERKVPRLKISRVEFHEGGTLSDNRIYLRLARERYAFDLCAAPFGSGFFFSLRFVETPRGGWLQLIGLLILLWILFAIAIGGFYAVRASFLWLVGFAVLACAAYWVFKHAEVKSKPGTSNATPSPALFPSEMPDFDAFFLNLPVIGDWYERSRKDTYFRNDTRMIYQTLITDIVKRKVDEVTAVKGVKLLKTYDYNPILGELYKTTTFEPGRNGEPLIHGVD